MENHPIRRKAVSREKQRPKIILSNPRTGVNRVPGKPKFNIFSRVEVVNPNRWENAGSFFAQGEIKAGMPKVEQKSCHRFMRRPENRSSKTGTAQSGSQN
jgi:hypothetical protein